MELRARIPAMPERRSEQTPARLARKVGPLFGVKPDTPQALGPWQGDYTRVTLTEIMRGAPTPAKKLAAKVRKDRGVDESADLAPIANATAARYGPDTKAAFVLTGANVLFRPISAALRASLDRFRETYPELDDHPDILIGCYAYLVIELFRSEPALLQAAVQAQAVQRALTAVHGAAVKTGEIDSFAAHEWGWPSGGEYSETPTELEILRDLADYLTHYLRRFLTTAAPDEDEQVTPEERLRNTIMAATTATLLDLSKGQFDAGLRVIETPSGRRADLMVDFLQRSRRFAFSIAPHVPGTKFPDPDADLKALDTLSGIAPAPVTGEDLPDRANLTVFSGLLEGYVALFGSRHTRTNPIWEQKFSLYADVVSLVSGPGSVEHLLAELRAVTASIRSSTGSDGRTGRLAELVKRAVELVRNLDRAGMGDLEPIGRVCPAVNILLVSLQRIRDMQALTNDASDLRLAELNDIVHELWRDQLGRLQRFFDATSPQYLLQLHNYASFLMGEGAAVDMFAEGDALYSGERSLIEVRKRAAGQGDTLEGAALRGARDTAQVALRGWSRYAFLLAETDAKAAAQLLRKADRYAEQLERQLDAAQEHGDADIFDSEYLYVKIRVALAHLYLARAKFSGDPDVRGQLLDVAEGHLVRAGDTKVCGLADDNIFRLDLRRLTTLLKELRSAGRTDDVAASKRARKTRSERIPSEPPTGEFVAVRA